MTRCVKNYISYAMESIILGCLRTALSCFHEAVKLKPQNSQQLAETYEQVHEAIKAFWDMLEKKPFTS